MLRQIKNLNVKYFYNINIILIFFIRISQIVLQKMKNIIFSIENIIFFIFCIRDVAQFGSAPVLGTGGRRFESCHPDNFD